MRQTDYPDGETSTSQWWIDRGKKMDAEIEDDMALAREWNANQSRGRISMPAMVPHIMLDVITLTGTQHPDYGRYQVNVHHSYDIKGALKTRGYRYNGFRTCWTRLYDTYEDAIQEAESLHADLGVQLGDGQVK